MGAAAIHTLTASGAVVGLFAMNLIVKQEFVVALWLMFLTLLIDGVDGPLARKINITQVMPTIDGKVIDHVVDFFNYGVVPAFFLINLPTLANSSIRYVVASVVVLATCYWYGRVDQNAGPHCFKRFPCLWNVVIGYLFLCGADEPTFYAICLVFAIATFIPVNYPRNFSMSMIKNSILRKLSHIALVLTIGSTVYLLKTYPARPWPILAMALSYWSIYLATPIFMQPLPKQRSAFTNFCGSEFKE